MFRIQIIEIAEVKEVVSGSWVTIGTKDSGSPEYGYAPDREESVKKERTVLVQEVCEIDLPAVIKAINGL